MKQTEPSTRNDLLAEDEHAYYANQRFQSIARRY